MAVTLLTAAVAQISLALDDHLHHDPYKTAHVMYHKVRWENEEIEAERPKSGELLLETDVSRVDAWIFVVATKHAHAAEARNRIGYATRGARHYARWRRHDVRPNWSRHA